MRVFCSNHYHCTNEVCLRKPTIKDLKISPSDVKWIDYPNSPYKVNCVYNSNKKVKL